LRSSVVPQSRQAADVSRVAYQASRVDFMSLIDTQRSLLDAELSYYRALNDREVALADLSRAVGMEIPSAMPEGK
jgi:outer membrane protein TolC